MSHRSTTTTNIMIVLFGDVRGHPKQWILVASLPPQNKTRKNWINNNVTSIHDHHEYYACSLWDYERLL